MVEVAAARRLALSPRAEETPRTAARTSTRCMKLRAGRPRAARARDPAVPEEDMPHTALFAPRGRACANNVTLFYINAAASPLTVRICAWALCGAWAVISAQQAGAPQAAGNPRTQHRSGKRVPLGACTAGDAYMA